MDIKDKTVVITGGAGFIGSHLVDTLMREDCIVRVIDNLATGKLENLKDCLNNKRFEFIRGSITASPIIGRAVKKADIVFHLACLGVRHSIKYSVENHRVNADGTLSMLEEARKAGVRRFVHISSSEVYGTAHQIPMPEDHPTYPCTVYGASKLAGEAYARAYYRTYGLPTTILRVFNTYGPRSHHEGDGGELIPKSIVRALNNVPVLIFGDGSQTRDFSYAEDIAQAILAAVRQDKTVGLTLNVGNDSEISVKDVAKKILSIIGSSQSRIEYRNNRPGDVRRLYADSVRFRKMTSWQPKTSFEEGLAKTIQWFKSKPEGASALFKEEVEINWQ